MATPGRELLDRLDLPEPWRSNIIVSLAVIDDLDLHIAALTVQLKRQGADHRYIPLLVTAPGIGWFNAYTIASEIGDIGRFASATKLCGYTGLCPRVKQSDALDARGPISKHGPKYLRWALFEAALNACKHPYYPSAANDADRRQGRAGRRARRARGCGRRPRCRRWLPEVLESSATSSAGARSCAAVAARCLGSRRADVRRHVRGAHCTWSFVRHER